MLYKMQSHLDVVYEVRTCKNIFSLDRTDILYNADETPSNRRLMLIDEVVYHHFKESIHAYFDHHEIDFTCQAIPCREDLKNHDTLMKVLNYIWEFYPLRKSEPILAVGGGVLMDVVGFASSIYRRSIPYIRIPTTLMGLVDAGIAAKTSINHFGRRNIIGSYHPPIATLLDKHFLCHLQPYEICTAMGEIIKLSVIKDEVLFSLVERYANDLITTRFQTDGIADLVIERAVTGMLKELEPNLWEKNLRRLMDFGHNFSPLVEMAYLPELAHGQAVALDVLFCCILSKNRGLLSEHDLMRVFKTMQACQLPVYHRGFTDEKLLVTGFSESKAHHNGDQNLPLPTKIGVGIFVNDLTVDEIKKACKQMASFENKHAELELEI